MKEQTKNVPAAKAVTFVAFAFLVAIGALFLSGLLEFKFLFEKETYGMSAVIDEIELIVEDVSGYFKGLWEPISLLAENIEKGSGIALLCITVLMSIFPLVSILCFVMIALHLVFSWVPLARIGSIGWNRACIRMGKKLKKVVGWVIGYIVYAFAVYGKGTVDFSGVGEMVLYLIAAYAIVRVLFDGLGKKNNVVNTVLTTVSTAAIAVFAVLVFEHLLFETALWSNIFMQIECAITSMQGETKDTESMISFIMMAVCWLFVFISLQRSVKVMEKQITLNKGGARKSLIWLLIWIVAAAVLSFFACKNAIDNFTFGDWKKWEMGKFFMKAVIYGLVGLGLVIVTPILNSIGKSKSKDDEE